MSLLEAGGAGVVSAGAAEVEVGSGEGDGVSVGGGDCEGDDSEDESDADEVGSAEEDAGASEELKAGDSDSTGGFVSPTSSSVGASGGAGEDSELGVGVTSGTMEVIILELVGEGDDDESGVGSGFGGAKVLSLSPGWLSGPPTLLTGGTKLSNDPVGLA